MKNFQTLLLGTALTAVIATSGFADELRARVKAVDADKNTVTVIEGHRDYSFVTTADTKFLNVKGDPLANGIKSGDLKEGRRVIVEYTTKDGALVLDSIQIRP